MEQRIITFFAVLLVALWLIRLFPGSIFSRIAFSWIGPVPLDGETWGRYQVRWAFYALDWLGQLAILLLLLIVAAYFFPSIQEKQVFLVFAAFALPMGAVMALVAALTYFIKAAKARYVGPNPVYGGQQ
jgi:hypothetical protein